MQKAVLENVNSRIHLRIQLETYIHSFKHEKHPTIQESYKLNAPSSHMNQISH
jgi:hypothetical protein